MSTRHTTLHILAALLLLLAWSAQDAEAQPADAIVLTAAQGIVGVNQVGRGDIVQIYTVQLQDGVGNGVVCDLGLAGTNLGIQITLSDLSTPTNIMASDIASVSLFRSTDATYDGGDTFINTQTPTIGGVIEFDATGAGINRRLPDPGSPPFPYFIVVATISATASLGTAFRLGTGAGHIGIDETGIGGIDGVLGAVIAASDANHVVIGSVAKSGGNPVSIPFGGEVIMLVLLIGTGIFVLRQRVA